jgi:CRP-like cAMP-binding protein
MTSPDPAVVRAVSDSPFGGSLSPTQIAALAGLTKLLIHHPHEILAQEGTVDPHLFCVVEGSLDVVKHLGTPDETVLATLYAGDLAHELGFLDGMPRYASLVATSPTRVLSLERTALEGLIETDPRILYSIMCAIVRNVHRVQARLLMQAAELTNYVVKQHGRY